MSFAAAQTAQPSALVFKHVTVIDATGAPAKANFTITIAGDRITQIGPTGKIHFPKDAQVIDASGKYLIPGLWDMHVHVSDKAYLPLFLANGVTGVRVMWGFPYHHEWRKAIDAGHLPGTRMTIASPIIDGPKPYWLGSIAITEAAQARQAVTDSIQRGADFLKVYEFLPRESYLAIAAEAKKQGVSFAGHVPLSVSAEEASNAGQKSFEHLIGILPACSSRSEDVLQAQQADLAQDIKGWGRPKFWGPQVKQMRQTMLGTFSPEKAAQLFDLLKRNGTWQCPTLTLLHVFGYGDDPALKADPRLKYMPHRETATWDASKIDGGRSTADFAFSKQEFQMDLQVVGAMQRAGVGILAGTDTPNPYCFPGFGLHDELGFLVKAGLTPMEALQAATLNPARFLGKEKDLGTIEAGKIADLVLLDANPLEDIGNTRKIAAIVYGGKLYSRAALDDILAVVERAAARLPISNLLFKTIQEQGIAAAMNQYRELASKQRETYDSSENEFIVLGYRLISAKRYKDAIEVFKLSVELYPESYNTYDSLAEAYSDDGQKELAIQNYEKSLELYPFNTNGAQRLKALKAK